MSSPSAPSFAVDLSNCDREPIHILGTIQPFGLLLASNADWEIVRVSANAEAHLGLAPDALLGQSLYSVFDTDAMHAIRNRVTLLRGPDAVERLFGIRLRTQVAPFDIAVHMSGDDLVIEAEPAVVDEVDAGSLVRSLLARLRQTDGLAPFLREGARQVRALTGFDRVMVYRFDRTGSGEVVAESLTPGTDSFLGLNYPASDIPAQARALYLRNVFRIIADVKAPPVPILACPGPAATALDLSLSVLRAVSPIHIEYLGNMGVEASLSISIVVEGRLWGLFACHHYAPRLPSFALRSGAELFGQMFSLMLESRERQETAEYETQGRQLADRLMSTVARDRDLLFDARWLGDLVLDAIPADGVGVRVGENLSLSGLTPDRAQFDLLLAALAGQAHGQVYTTDSIAALLPGAAEYAGRAAGLLAIPLSRAEGEFVVLFRSEQLRAVRWAGNPEKPVEYGPNGARLTPRKSFEEWSELVKGRALPFNAAQLRVAETLRNALLEVVVTLAGAAIEERQRAHERQELLIAELNHRVRNILALIRGLISQTRRNAVTTQAFVTTLDDRVQALARAHDQITADRWGPGRLIDLIETEAGAYLGVKRDRVRCQGPDVLLEPTAFTVLALVLHELITNAAKYGALADSGSIGISWRIDADGSLLLDWAESGGPAVTAPQRRGFGSTIIERSIPHELGGRAAVRYRLTGLEADFCVPSRYIARVLPAGTEPARRGAPAPGPAQSLAGQRVLLVEDSMIIAMDAEDALRELGATDVVTAASCARALEAIGQHRFDAAVLDFNLGGETSLPVAEALHRQGVPFLFASGYGDQLALPAQFADRVVLKKPYAVDGLGKALAEMRV